MPWNPDRYNKFQNERSAPFEDLLQMLNRRPGLKVIDLGCGTGELTRRLADALPESDVLGLDQSPEMLARAQTQLRPGLRFERGDLAALEGTWDLIFSNAALQWSEDHQKLIPHLFSCLNPGGQMLVQVPSNHGGPAHLIIREVAGRGPFSSALNGWTRKSPVLNLEEYAGMLYRQGAIEIKVLAKIYPHLLANADAIIEWISGTALVPYFERLPDSLHEAFTEAIQEELHTGYPHEPVFYPFKRTLFSVIRPAA
jgi:trans-aconitate 2-methyltransferase